MEPILQKILIIDDSQVEIDLIQNFLNSVGYITSFAKNGKSAIKKLLANSVDLVILDIVLEDENGYDVCKTIKENPETRDIPVIFLTGMADDESIVKGLSVGARDYMKKPFNKQELLLRIKNVLAQDENEKRYSILTNYAPVGIIVHIDNIIQFANPESMQIVGANTENQLVGKNILNFIIPTYKGIVNEHRKELNEVGFATAYDIKITRIDGSERYVSVAGKKIDYLGYDATLVFFFDVDYRKQVEQKLQQQYVFQRILMDSIPNPVFFKDGDLVFKGCNKAFEKFLGISKNDLIGKTVFDISPLENAQTYHKMDVELITNRGTQVYESKVKTKSDFREVIFNKAIFPNEEGGIGGLIGVIQDLTEHKKSENELRILLVKLEKSEKYLKDLLAEKDKFFSIIAHDLKSPMSGFLGLSKMMIEDFYNLPLSKIQIYSQAIYDSMGNLYKLIENLLEWAELQRGIIPFNPEQLLISELFNQNILLFKNRFEQKELTIESSIPENLGVFADRHMINSIIRNLVSNAIKFTPRKGKITCNASSIIQEKGVRIEISDTGVGIPKDKINMLFKIDQRISTPGTEGEPSTGLGLLLCKEFVDKHNGTIEVKSIEDEGTKFILNFPSNTDWLTR